MAEWFQHVKDYEYQAAGSCDSDYLSSSTFSVFCSFDNTGKIEKLQETISNREDNNRENGW